MAIKLTAREFIGWFLAFAGLLAMGTILFAQVLWFTVPLIAGRGCVSGGPCGAMAMVLGTWLKPSLLLAAICVGIAGFYRRGLAVGSRFWALFPLALLLPNLPSLFLLGNIWGADLAPGLLFFPRWSIFELAPLLALGGLLCFQIEYLPGFAGSIARTRLYDSIPIGAIYIISCLWVGSDLLLSLSPHLGIPISEIETVRTLMYFPVSLADGVIFVGLPAHGQRPDIVISLGTLLNLIAFAVLVFALVADGSGRLRRAGALVFIEKTSDADASRNKPLFGPGRRHND